MFPDDHDPFDPELIPNDPFYVVEDKPDEDEPTRLTCRQLLLIALTLFVILAMVAVYSVPNLSELISQAVSTPRPTPTLPGIEV